MRRWDVEQAVRGSDLPPPARLLVLTLATYTEQGTTVVPAQFSPSLNKLASATGLDRRTVMRHLDALEDAGWLVRRKPSVAAQRTEHARTMYRLTTPAGGPLPPGQEAEDHQPGGTEPPGLGAQRHEAGGSVPPNQNEITRTNSDRQVDPFTELDATDEERQEVIRRISEMPGVRNPPALVKHLARSGDLRTHLDAVRAQLSKKSSGAAIHACRECDAHGWRLQPGSRATPITPYERCDHTPQRHTA